MTNRMILAAATETVIGAIRNPANHQAAVLTARRILDMFPSRALRSAIAANDLRAIREALLRL